MPLPELSKQTTKIISLTTFSIIAMLKILCILLISGQIESPCIAGWHVNKELFDHLILLGMGLIPDIAMIVCIGVGLAFKVCNIGADPGTIIYNFTVGLLTFCSFFPFLNVEDCKSDNLGKIKSSGIIAAVAGVLQIANGVICLLFLAAEESDDFESHSAPTPKPLEKSEPKPSTSKTPNEKKS